MLGVHVTFNVNRNSTVFDNAHAGGKECKMHVIFMEIIER
jgi:hypothetical protein